MADAGRPAQAAAVLQVLWLADNQIRRVDGLATLLALRELNLAANPIATVGNAFVANTSLQQLNLADTHISSFKQVGPPLTGSWWCQPRGSMPDSARGAAHMLCCVLQLGSCKLRAELPAAFLCPAFSAMYNLIC